MAFNFPEDGEVLHLSRLRERCYNLRRLIDQWECRMPDIGPVELIIILVIVVLVFGVGRLSKIGGEMGSAIREFRQGIKGAPDGKQDQPEEEQQPPQVPPPS